MKKKSYLTLITLLSICIIALGFFLTYKPRPTRYAVFAGYNPNSILEPYILTYLKGLNEITDGIVYITDSPLLETEKAKLKKFNILFSSFNRHNEYDWGSYKRGYLWLKNNGYLEKADEVIFANDSCFAPITDFKEMFSSMEKHKTIDFWGNTQSAFRYPHLQSYFMVFRKRILHSEIFDKFFTDIKYQPTHLDYIFHYEIPLTTAFSTHGFSWKSYIIGLAPPLDNIYYHPLTYLKEYKNQFIKKKIYTSPEVYEEMTEDRFVLLDYLKNNHYTTYQNILLYLTQKQKEQTNDNN